jgi:hypothetical protein
MCESCIEIDKRVERLQQSLRSTEDASKIESINLTIAQLYQDRVRLHQNPQR